MSDPAAPHHEAQHIHNAQVAHVQHTVASHPVHHSYYKGKADAEGAFKMMDQMMGPVMNM